MLIFLPSGMNPWPSGGRGFAKGTPVTANRVAELVSLVALANFRLW